MKESCFFVYIALKVKELDPDQLTKERIEVNEIKTLKEVCSIMVLFNRPTKELLVIWSRER